MVQLDKVPHDKYYHTVLIVVSDSTALKLSYDGLPAAGMSDLVCSVIQQTVRHTCIMSYSSSTLPSRARGYKFRSKELPKVCDIRKRVLPAVRDAGACHRKPVHGIMTVVSIILLLLY